MTRRRIVADDAIGSSARPSIPDATRRRRILLVEDWAHVRAGHFPIRFAELAEGFVDAGCRVDVLTSRGWALADSSGSVPFAVGQYGPFRRIASRFASLMLALGATPVATWPRRIGLTLRVIVMIGAARAQRRRAVGDPPDVVVISWEVNPVLATVLAGPGRWILYQYSSPPVAMSALSRALSALARRIEAHRRRVGGRVHIVVQTEEWASAWASLAPFIATEVIPLTGARTCASIPGARARLGLAPDERVALMFGAVHPEKDCSVVWRAFTELPDWRLLIVGTVAGAYTASLEHLRLGQRPIVIDGYVDNAWRDLAYAAADVVVLSFRPNHYRDSGVLADAIAWGVPVVCSTSSASAECVAEYGLGVAFESGDASSLVRAVSSIPRVRPEDVERARRALSNVAVARRWLHAMDSDLTARGRA